MAALHWTCTKVRVLMKPLLWFEEQRARKVKENTLYKRACESLAYKLA